MPCEQIRQNQVTFSAGTDMELMNAALEAEGYRVSQYANGLSFAHEDNWRQGGTFRDGVFNVNEGTDTDAIKRAYSLKAVQKAAKKFSWTIKADSKNKLKMTVSKRA